MTSMLDERHVAYVDQKYRYTTDDGVDVYSDPRPVYCGDWSTLQGGTVLCDECEDELKARYPQGWHYYPGDVCPHGVYTGGVGIDLMCPVCELGDEEDLI